MATKPIAIQRALPAIVADLATTRQRYAALDADLIGQTLTIEQDANLRGLAVRAEALEAEFDAAFYGATGVSWQLAEGVRT